MKQVLPDLDVFVDVLALRAGQKWERELRFQLQAKDTFFLFWSRSAARSKEVKKERRLALELRGLEYIAPIPLVDPRMAPPPKELASLHFNDLYRLCEIEPRKPTEDRRATQVATTGHLKITVHRSIGHPGS